MRYSELLLMDWQQEQLISALRAHATDKRALVNFIEVILSDREFEGISTRLEILRALIEGHESHRTIADRLKVSIATVTRMGNIARTRTDACTKVIQRMK